MHFPASHFPHGKPGASPHFNNHASPSPDTSDSSKTPSSNDNAADDRGVTQKSLHWHILGGNNKHRIGANCGLCVYEETSASGIKTKRALLFDAGILSGDSRMPEDPLLADSDTIMPDLSAYLRKKDDPSHQPDTVIDSIYLTHNHGDHLGAIPFLILTGHELPKIYATPYTAKRLEQELANAGVPSSEWPEIYMIAPGKPIEEGPVKVSAFWVSHSTPQSAGFFIETPEGNILNPGDFKLDQTVLWGPAFNRAQFDRVIDGKTVDLLLLDSTGADRDITPVTEADVRDTLRDVMAQYPDKRIIIAVMGGFEENLASAARVASEKGRTVWLAGWSHEQSLSALKETGMTLGDHIGANAAMPLDLRILNAGKGARDLEGQRPGQAVVIVTGAQGKPSAVLTRATEGNHPALTLHPDKDIVLFCAPSIPGQEGGRQRLFAMLRNKKIPFLTRQEVPLYSHAHARLPEIREMVKMADPKTVVPIHGDDKLRGHCADAAGQLGKTTLGASNGDVLRITKAGTQSIGPVTKDAPHLVGFKTLQGSTWTDRHYLMTRTADRALIVPQTPQQKRRPRIFDIKG